MSRKVYGIILSILLIFMVSFSFSTVHAAPIESNPNWNIHFENIQIKEESVTATTVPTIDASLTEITYAINLDTPGQFYEFTADVKNGGSIDAMLDEVLSTTLTTEQQRYLMYSVTYSNGTAMTKGDKLDAGATETIKVRVEFKKDITANDLPSRDTSIELTLNLRYVQADENAQDVEEPGDGDSTGTGENANNGQDGSSSGNTNGDNQGSGAKPSGVQTGDSIIVCFAIAAVALVVLVFASRKKDKTEDK